MPSGGKRAGAGAPKGRTGPRGPQKRTIERQEIARQTLDAARAGELVLGKVVLEEMMNVAKSVMAQFQPISEEMVKLAASKGQTIKERPGDVGQFGGWWDRTVFAAKELAKYQSPQFRAVMVAPAPDTNPTERRRRFGLTVFEGGKPVKTIEVTRTAKAG